jgi:hypothetical protein
MTVHIGGPRVGSGRRRSNRAASRPTGHARLRPTGVPSSGRCISLNESDAIELADLLTFLANWLSGTQQHTRADSLTTFVGHTAPRCIDDPAPDLMVFRAFMGDVTFASLLPPGCCGRQCAVQQGS